MLDCDVNPHNLLDMLRYRRSIRQFKSVPVEEEKLDLMLQAGRYTQTGGNSQAVRYVMIQNEKSRITEMALKGLLRFADEIERAPERYHPRNQRFARLWRQYDKEFLKSGKTQDVLFYGSPVQILIIADNEINAGMAAQSLNLMAVAQGLGVLFCGFCQMGVQYSEELRQYLELLEGEQVYACMCIGYPSVDYFRTAQRDSVRVSIK